MINSLVSSHPLSPAGHCPHRPCNRQATPHSHGVGFVVLVVVEFLSFLLSNGLGLFKQFALGLALVEARSIHLFHPLCFIPLLNHQVLLCKHLLLSHPNAFLLVLANHPGTAVALHVFYLSVFLPLHLLLELVLLNQFPLFLATLLHFAPQFLLVTLGLE